MTFKDYFNEDIETKYLKSVLFKAYCWELGRDISDEDVVGEEFIRFINYVENDEVPLYDYINEFLDESEKEKLYNEIELIDNSFNLDELKDYEKENEGYRYFHSIQYEMFPIMIKEIFNIDINYRFNLEN